MATWISADLHFGDDRFEIMNRPFSSNEEMMETIIRNFNAVIKPEDYLIIAGDACYQGKAEYLPQIARINGGKTLVRGNHDRNLTDEDLASYFIDIREEHDGMDIKLLDGTKLYIHHYPSKGKTDVFNLVGHIHSAWRFQLNMMNVGVDVNHFRPVALESISKYINAINNFYDEDVWAAYQPSNENYRQIRGQSGSRIEEIDKIAQKKSLPYQCLGLGAPQTEDDPAFLNVELNSTYERDDGKNK